MKLFTYFRSSAAWRVRIALNLKGVAFTSLPVHLLKNGGEQHGEAFRDTNPLGLVPALATDTGEVLTQSLAIIEWLEETHPVPALLPADPVLRARVRAFALAIACDIHPLDNLRVLRYLKREMGQAQPAIDAWYCHWIAAALPSLEASVARLGGPGPWCFGPEPGFADVVLIPQLGNARRLDCPLGAFPLLLRAEAAADTHPAFAAASPAAQPDAG